METESESKMKHTPEPWDVCESDNSSLIHVETRHDHPTEAGRQICTANRGTRNERLANASRIVECVNALSGIKDPFGTLRKVKEALDKYGMHMPACQEKRMEALLDYNMGGMVNFKEPECVCGLSEALRLLSPSTAHKS